MPSPPDHQSYRILLGNAPEVLKSLPDSTFHCCVTSPPFWGLRDYEVPPTIWGGHPGCAHRWNDVSYYRENSAARTSSEGVSGAGPENAKRLKKARWRKDAFCLHCGAWRGCLGLEPTPQLYIEHLVQVFREVHRVLRPDGTLWLNLGDTYARERYQGKWRVANPETSPHQKANGMPNRYSRRTDLVASGLKKKDLVGIPWRVALALQQDGWYLRSDIIWQKRNNLPESVSDRPTNCHEHLFLCSKRPHYYYDQEAIREPLQPSTLFREERGQRDPFARQKQNAPPERRAKSPFSQALRQVSWSDGRNRRSVWTLGVRPGFGGHIAAFPPGLVEPCIRAGTSEWGSCADCGGPYRRVVEKRESDVAWQRASGGDRNGDYHGHSRRERRPGLQDASDVKRRILAGMRRRVTVGWEPTCRCSRKDPVPCRVLDPFSGSGTTGWVAMREGRSFTGIELKPEYVELSEERPQEARG